MPPISFRSPAVRGRATRTFVGLAVLVAAACGDDSALPTQVPNSASLDVTGSPEDETIAGQYVVMLRSEVSDAPIVARLLLARHGGALRRTYRSAIKGFAARLSLQQLRRLRSDPLVVLVEPDGIVYADGNDASATWGLDRIDQRPAQLDGRYQYARTGVGVSVYIVDTGIRYSHSEFGGRASIGFDAFGGDGTDCNGHGTHVAGTVGGRTYGVAKAVALRSVRVLNCTGSGSYSGVIAGLDWIANYAARPAVVNMSLGGGASTALDSAVSRMSRAGITVVAAAGNANSDACNVSPARAADAITVGATDKTDTRASFSNYGSCVDLFAPGVGITSGIHTADDAEATLNGTSMAAPHAAGAAALFLERHPMASPGEVAGALTSWATRGVVKSSASTHNDLLFTLGDTTSGVDGAPSALFSVTCTSAVCQFSEKATDADGALTKWQWDFGDGMSSASRNPSHDFVWNGTYRVTLVVTDDKGNTGAYAAPVTIIGGLTPNTLPSAHFVWECKERLCTFIDNSSDADGTITKWQWNFGDGSPATNQPTASRYYASVGVYDVTLTVTDDRGGSDSQVYTISVGANAPPIAAFEASCSGLTCQFTDQSTDSDGTITSRSWSFGDGSPNSSATSASHVFAAAGTYPVTLSVTDDKGATNLTTRSITVATSNSPPVASFTVSCSLLVCSFTDASSDTDGSIVKWVWDFGDGSGLTNQSSTHTYPASGTYSVSLTVTDNRGSTANTVRQVTVSSVTNAAPVAEFTYTCTGTTCRFNDASRDADGSITSWRWEFGDGTTSSDANPIRTFAAGGTYIVRLDVADNGGALGTTSRTITLAPTPIQLTTTAYKIKGAYQVDLVWTGASGTDVIVYRNGSILVQTANDGRHTDSARNSGRGDYLYRVCEASGSACSADVLVQVR